VNPMVYDHKECPWCYAERHPTHAISDWGHDADWCEKHKRMYGRLGLRTQLSYTEAGAQGIKDEIEEIISSRTSRIAIFGKLPDLTKEEQWLLMSNCWKQTASDLMKYMKDQGYFKVESDVPEEGK